MSLLDRPLWFGNRVDYDDLQGFYLYPKIISKRARYTEDEIKDKYERMYREYKHARFVTNVETYINDYSAFVKSLHNYSIDCYDMENTQKTNMSYYTLEEQFQKSYPTNEDKARLFFEKEKKDCSATKLSLDNFLVNRYGNIPWCFRKHRYEIN